MSLKNESKWSNPFIWNETVLMAYHPVLGYFMPRGQGITKLYVIIHIVYAVSHVSVRHGQMMSYIP